MPSRQRLLLEILLLLLLLLPPARGWGGEPSAPPRAQWTQDTDTHYNIDWQVLGNGGSHAWGSAMDPMTVAVGDTVTFIYDSHHNLWQH